MANPPPNLPAKPRPSRLSFSLRTLLLATTLLCALLGRGVYLHRWRVGLGEYMRARSIEPESWNWTKPWSQPWKQEVAYFLTGNASWLGEVPKSRSFECPPPLSSDQLFAFPAFDPNDLDDPMRQFYLYAEEFFLPSVGDDFKLIPYNESELLIPIDNEGVRFLRAVPYWDGRVDVSIGKRQLTASDTVLSEAPPIQVDSLDLSSGQIRWLHLFDPSRIDWSGPLTPADRRALENCATLNCLRFSSVAPCESELAQSPKLCLALKWAKLDAEKADLPSWRRVIAQSPFLRRLEISSNQLDKTFLSLGPLPLKIYFLKFNLPGDSTSSPGAAIARAMAKQKAEWMLEVNDKQLGDEDLIALLKIPHLTRLKCDGAFTERGVAALAQAKSLEILDLNVTQIDSAALLNGIKKAPSLRSLRLRGVDVPHDTAAALRTACDFWSEIQTAKE